MANRFLGGRDAAVRACGRTFARSSALAPVSARRLPCSWRRNRQRGSFGIAAAASSVRACSPFGLWWRCDPQLDLWPSIVDRFSPHVRLRLRAGLVSLGVIVAGAGVTLAVSLALHFSTGLTILERCRPGLIGKHPAVLARYRHLPNALIWASSFVVGRDFAAGQDTIIRLRRQRRQRSWPSAARRYSTNDNKVVGSGAT